MQARALVKHTPALLFSHSMLALRLSAFTLAWLGLGGQDFAVGIGICSFAAIVLYAITHAKRVFLLYCHIVAATVWMATSVTLAFSSGSSVLIGLTASMALLDAIAPSVHRGTRDGLA